MIVQDNNFNASRVVTVIICTYNQEGTIAQSIESVLAQRCSYPLELIIAEDCSKDSTRDICIEYQKKYPDTIRLLLHEKNQGLLRNYYEALVASNGKYIGQVAGDDYWQNPDKTQLQIDFLESNPGYGIVHSEYDELDSYTGKFSHNIHEASGRPIPEGNVMKQLFYNYHMAALTICFRKDLFFQYVPFDDFLRLDFKLEDIPMFVIMSKHCKVGYLPVSTSTYRRNHSSISNPTAIATGERYFNQLQVVNRYLANMFPEDLKYDERIQDIYKYTSLLTIAYNCRDYTHAKEYGEYLTKLGVKTKRIFFSRNPLLFNIFYLLKKANKLFTR